MTKHIIPGCSLLVAAVLAGGCSPQPTTPDTEFGASVRDVMGSQIHDTEAAINPDPNAVEGGDPYRLDAALNAHRSDVSKPQEVQQPITINAR